MSQYVYKFKVVADVSVPIPGVTEMFEEMTGERLTMSGKQLDVAIPIITAERKLTLEELEKAMEVVRVAFEEQPSYSHVRVYFFGKEELLDGPIH